MLGGVVVAMVGVEVEVVVRVAALRDVVPVLRERALGSDRRTRLEEDDEVTVLVVLLVLSVVGLTLILVLWGPLKPLRLATYLHSLSVLRQRPHGAFPSHLRCFERFDDSQTYIPGD